METVKWLEFYRIQLPRAVKVSKIWSMGVQMTKVFLHINVYLKKGCPGTISAKRDSWKPLYFSSLKST